MKKILLVSLLLLTNLQAGFFTSMFGSMAANALSSDKAQHRSASYEDKINSYLWNMYENKSFSKDWRFYADQLSNSNDIGRLDTVAQVYNSNGDKDKALEIYETKILPYLKFEKSSIRYKYEDYYNKIRGESNEIDYDKIISKLENNQKKAEEKVKSYFESSISLIDIVIIILLLLNLYMLFDQKKSLQVKDK